VIALAGLAAWALLASAQAGSATVSPGQPAIGKAAKRAGPKSVAPLIKGGLRIEVVAWPRDRGFAQNGGVIEAFDRRTGRSLWLLKIYDIAIDPQREADVQDIFITELRRGNGNSVHVIDELGRRWTVDVTTRQVRSA
jgi:hypothetical protein